MFISLVSVHGISRIMPFQVSSYPELMDSAEATVRSEVEDSSRLHSVH